MEVTNAKQFVESVWSWLPGRESTLFKALADFVRIPNLSPAFDPNWHENGNTDRAVEHLANAVAQLKNEWKNKGCLVDDINCRVLGSREQPLFDETGQRRSPLLFVEIPAFKSGAPGETVLCYGHLDKQPETPPWSNGLGPREPVVRDDRLYGRGAADDSYALFTAFTAVMALRAEQSAHGRCVILIESGEESGSVDLPYYLEELRSSLGQVSLIICLDSGCGDYEQLWLTDSLRGTVNLWLEVRVLSEGVHSGDASGVVPSSFRIMRRILSRLENETTGRIIPAELAVEISPERYAQARRVVLALGECIRDHFPFANPVIQPVDDDQVELLLNRTWRTQLAVTGIQGLPTTPETAGNVMLPFTRAKLSFRLPPTLDPESAAAFIKRELTRDPPYRAEVKVTEVETGAGWAAPESAPWLAQAVSQASRRYFTAGQEAIQATGKLEEQPEGNDGVLYSGEGGSIPLMGQLKSMFPQAQFVVTGVLGPHANAHGPDEFLHLPTAMKLTLCLAHILAAHGGKEKL